MLNLSHALVRRFQIIMLRYVRTYIRGEAFEGNPSLSAAILKLKSLQI